MASLFTNSESYDRTSVVPLDDGTTYLHIRIIPAVSGSKRINNDNYPNKENDKNIIEAIVSNFNIHWGTRTQFTYTLGKDLYAYTFGENADEISISGLGFRPCNAKRESSNDALNDLIDFWEKNNMGKHGKYCKIQIDKNIYKAYLTDGEIGSTDQVPGIFPFKFNFTAILSD